MGLRIGEELKKRGLTMATAESCTGGTIASMVTAVAGSSSYFKGAVVSYAVSVKEQVLGMEIREGIVSEDTARQMALGVARVCGADCAVATTGVAGPGASDGQPQGTVCISAAHVKSPADVDNASHVKCSSGVKSPSDVSNPSDVKSPSDVKIISETFHFDGDREEVILQASDAALRLLNQLICEEM